MPHCEFIITQSSGSMAKNCYIGP